MNIYANVVLGWTPILAVVADGSREVLEVTGWTGGSGTAPATGVYVGATGYVSNIALAVDIKGSDGAGVDIIAGTNTISSGAVNFSAANGVTFGLSGSTMTASVRTDYQSSGNYLTTAMQSDAGSNFVNTSQSSLFQQTSAMSNYLTNAKISAGTLSALRSDFTLGNSNGVSFGLNTNGVITASVNAAGGAQTGISGISAGTTSNNLGSIVLADANSMFFGLGTGASSRSITASYNDPDNWALYGNTSGTSASTIGTGGIYLQGGNNITLSGSSNTIVISAGGGAAYTALTFQNRQLGASGTSSGQNSVWLTPMRLVSPLSVSTIMQMVSLTGSSSTNTGSIGITYDMALYKVTQTTNLSRFDTIWTSQYLITGFMSSSNSAGYTVNGGASGQNLTTASANSNLLTQFGGIRELTFNLNTVLDAGLYAFGYRVSSSSVGNSAAIRSFNPVIDNPVPLGLGNGFGAATNNTIGYVDGGTYSVTSASMPVSFVFADIRQTANVVPYVKLGAV